MALLQKAYLGATPLFRDQAWYENYSPIINDVTGGITVTANSSAHTKGAWAQLIASTSADNSFAVVVVNGVAASATNTATLLDFALGASGSETAFISNIAVGGGSNLVSGFPIKIPSGSRLSARIQSVVTGGKTASVTTFLYNAGSYSTAPTALDVIGADTANSKGTSFSGSSGTWVEATSSTSQAYRAVAAVVSIHDADIANANNLLYTIGVGAAGNEVEFGTLRASVTNAEAASTSEPRPLVFGRVIPAGSRLAVKHALTVNPDRVGFTLIGIP
jgi:hypothetical protein